MKLWKKNHFQYFFSFFVIFTIFGHFLFKIILLKTIFIVDNRLVRITFENQLVLNWWELTLKELVKFCFQMCDTLPDSFLWEKKIQNLCLKQVWSKFESHKTWRSWYVFPLEEKSNLEIFAFQMLELDFCGFRN